MTKVQKLLIEILIIAIGAVHAMAETCEYGGYRWTYVLDGGSTLKKQQPAVYGTLPEGATLESIDPEPMGNLAVPSVLDGHTVVALDQNFLKHCQTITAVTIPGSVREISFYCFYDCPNLRTITLAEGLDFIGWKALFKCPCAKVVVPSTVTQLYVQTLCGSGATSVIFEGSKPWHIYEHHGHMTLYDVDWADVVTYVHPGKGWDDIVASGTWQGRPIKFVDGEIPQGGDVGHGDWTVAHDFSGVVYDAGENCVGMIQIATKKATKKGVGVSGTMMLQDGKKISLKSMTVAPEGGVLNVAWTVKGYGKLNVTLGAEGFSGQFEDGGSVESQELDEDTGVLKASITMTYIDKKTKKLKTKKITFGGFVSGGEGVGTAQAGKKDPVKNVEFTVR